MSTNKLTEHHRMPPTLRIFLPAACWLGTLLRFRALFANSFHADEALFAGLARHIAVWRDPLLLGQPVDKPPLLFYLQAFFYPLFGPVEWAARMPNLIASLLLIPLTGMLAWRLFRDAKAAAAAALIVAVAPLSIQFSATAFSDPLLTFWLIAALSLAVRTVERQHHEYVTHSFLAGLTFGLALTTKYQALLFLPLMLGMAYFSRWRRRDWQRGLAGVVVGTLPFLLWLVARTEPGGLIARQWANIGGLRTAWSWELGPRLVAQAGLWQVGLGRPILIIGLILMAVFMVGHRYRTSIFTTADRMLGLFILGYGLLHWLWSVPIWDRYLLPLLPLVAILIGRGISGFIGYMGGIDINTSWRPVSRVLPGVLLVILAVSQLPVAAAARAGLYPIGGRADADGGAAQVARLLADAPYGTVLYDHWYSWHWRYHLFDKRVYVSWFPHADALLADLSVFGGGDGHRYIALPKGAPAAPLGRRLADAGYHLEPVRGAEESVTMVLYLISQRVEQ
jgi:4-amino-4-deoxy-L-arabinose transferase-like glycosyltransferase